MAKKKAEKAPKKAKKLPRQSSLPGMANTKIAAIEKLALDYAELRDERIELNRQESEIKQALIAAMHKAGKAEYKRNGISISLTVEKEGIKVRVRDEDEDEQPAKKNKSTSFDTEQLAAPELEEAPEPIEDTENIGQEEPGEAEA